MTLPYGYAPQNPDFLDTVAYIRRVVESIVRNNPLTDAVISEGLMKWLGNYNDGSGNRINYLWIGEFFPADTNISPTTAQRGFSLLRDDSRGGRTAINLYDPFPAGGGGLKQRLFIGSGDGQRFFDEARDGGWGYPEEIVTMYGTGSNTLSWIGVQDNSPSWGIIYEGRFNTQGRTLSYRFFAATTTGCAGNFRVRVAGVGGDVVGSTHSLGVTSSGVFEGTLDVSASRGSTVHAYVEGQRTNGVGEARAVPIFLRCYTP